ncbi:glycosyl hydrolase 53 domain-containing protein [Drepanopeziza brunnea f. sp. 'multigermtubi' MB_m1]|uniref:Glycosyl hydrolase 53 domain-containing protein n=1 Tax=Marssonina brunnea f. sp. multigermtubi (strain MB_m1) TaxID=1072389 RepID=K1WPD1_MARBU|nr:glycosyl hydrolase 53 domain-containing protein [Drepanopeziza brunnea f. sp. 'multigermtubi' MB_m1]EKD19510.1 glycosyl hydrolase 53 domain-containing protein [Drepanopeziza brunnea f. sp. 'multigermtubi' MB_m1]
MKLLLITIAAFLIALVSASPAPGHKRGLAFNNPSTYVQHFNGPNSAVSWAYNWDSTTDDAFPHNNLQFMPMLWSDAPDHTANASPSPPSPYLLLKNTAELTLSSGAAIAELESPRSSICISMSPQRAVDAYRKYMMPFAHREISLGAPAVTNGPDGLPWLREFVRLCTGCQIDFLPIHWYDAATNILYFKNHLAEAHAVTVTGGGGGSRQIWLTEFHGSGTPDEQVAFLRDVMPWMDATPWISRYAWFWTEPSYDQGALVHADGQPTALGLVYAYTPSPLTVCTCTW